jgi:hypothetical protein
VRASRSGSGSKSPERETDILQALFGIPGTEFRRRVAGRKYLLHHGKACRLDALLDAGNISSQAALERLAVNYARPINRVVYAAGGVLGFRRLRAGERRGMMRAPQACYFLVGYDSAFRKLDRLRQALCAAVGSPLRSAHCSGTLHTPGAILPRHCDSTDVIVLQIFGNRRWRLQRNSDPPRGLYAQVRSSSRRRNGWSAAFARASPTVSLKPGSALYVPRGWWHETRSASHSFALVITVGAAKKR